MRHGPRPGGQLKGNTCAMKRDQRNTPRHKGNPKPFDDGIPCAGQIPRWHGEKPASDGMRYAHRQGTWQRFRNGITVQLRENRRTSDSCGSSGGPLDGSLRNTWDTSADGMACRKANWLRKESKHGPTGTARVVPEVLCIAGLSRPSRRRSLKWEGSSAPSSPRERERERADF